MLHFKGQKSFFMKQHQRVMFLVESKLFVQHSVDVKGEHGSTRWRSHGAPIPVQTEKHTSTIPGSTSVFDLAVTIRFSLTVCFGMVLCFYLLLWKLPYWTVLKTQHWRKTSVWHPCQLRSLWDQLRFLQTDSHL